MCRSGRCWRWRSLASAAQEHVPGPSPRLRPRRCRTCSRWDKACCRTACRRCSTGCSTAPARMAGALIGLWLERAGSWGWLQRTGEHWFAQHSRTGACAAVGVAARACCSQRRLRLGWGRCGSAWREVLHDRVSSWAAASSWLQWLDAGPAHAASAVATGRTAGRGAGAAGALPARPTAWRGPGLRRVWLALGATALGFGVTTLSTALNFGPQHALAWCTAPAWRAWPRARRSHCSRWAAGGAWRPGSGWW